MYPKQMPAEIKEKLTLLNHHKAEVERLSQLIEISEEEIERLEAELELYQASIAPIRECPAEILVEIFKMYIDKNPRLIRRLLLVCKHWCNLAIGVPHLWTRIPITIDSRDVEAKTAAKSIKRRLSACIKYSKDQLLHINLDLTELLGPKSYLNHKSEEVIEGLSIHPDWNIDLFEDVKIDWDRYKEDFQELPWSLFHILNLFDALRGSNEKTMKRWGSLSIQLPNDFYPEEINHILEKLVGATPNLRSLALHASKRDDIKPLNHIVFSDLYSLRGLVLGHCNLLPVIDLSSLLKLEHCDVVWPTAFYMLNLASDAFSSVRTLILRWDGHYDLDDSPPSVMVGMPMLHTLEFRGVVQGTERIQYDLPSLRNLFIERTYPDEFTAPPDVRPATVTWGVVDSKYRNLWDQMKRREALKVLLKRYGMIESINVHKSAEDDLLLVLEDLKATGYILSLLKKIGIIDNWKVEAEFRVRMID